MLAPLAIGIFSIIIAINIKRIVTVVVVVLFVIIVMIAIPSIIYIISIALSRYDGYCVGGYAPLIDLNVPVVGPVSAWRGLF